MSIDRIRTLVGLDLRQRVRSVAWYVLLGVYALLLIGVTALAFLAFGFSHAPGGAIYSTVVFVTLLLVVLVSPALTGNAINGDRESATLAAVQVTLATTGEIIWGKFLAGWITGLAFAAVAAPFMIIATFAGGVSPLVVLISLLVLIVEIGVIVAIGVAFSGVLARPLFSVACTYLVVAALVVGTPIAFALTGAAMRTPVHSETRSAVYDDTGAIVSCEDWQTATYDTPRFDRVWWMLAANPFVILADATPTTFDENGSPTDMFGQLKYGVRSAQIPPKTENRFDECKPGSQFEERPTPEQVLAQTTPSWFVGITLQVVLAGLLLWWAWTRTRTPARRLPPGTRIA
ncbi:ABC transporter permease [Microbacterium sp. ASV49]|uniref:ABC transporter permease n=1 Tax=Microbacterium candidum TaxID=3041922 RepID=A0ABT7MYE8_9MICO|nr:ABC transporter permease [Microbacterium sp. ASV49]MDL9979455.1 ABC transporter permease [Microbacterium sp. ASV49]